MSYTVVLNVHINKIHPKIDKMKECQLLKIADNLERKKTLKKQPNVNRFEVTFNNFESNADSNDAIIKEAHAYIEKQLHLHVTLDKGQVF